MAKAAFTLANSLACQPRNAKPEDPDQVPRNINVLAIDIADISNQRFSVAGVRMGGQISVQSSGGGSTNPWILAQQALELVSQYGCAPSPKAYEVFFAYAAGNAVVSEQVKRAGGRENILTSFDLDRIHHDNFRSNDGEWERQQRASHVIESSIESAVSGLADQMEAGELYERQLEQASGRLVQTASPEDLTDVIKDLLEDTDTAKSATAAMHNSLISTRNRVSEITANVTASRTEGNKDLLTGLTGRRGFDVQLENDMYHARKNGVQMMLCMVSLDKFDILNTQYGRFGGDQIIRAAGRVVGRFANGNDVAARLSGTKFGLLMKLCSFQEALSTAEAIRSELTTREFTLKETSDKVGPIPVSVGLSVFRAEDSQADLLLRAAELLQDARVAGGNVVKAENPDGF
ncbi:MAG: GGDEF domain-containing protein [Paracoccaceae bacterium]